MEECEAISIDSRSEGGSLGGGYDEADSDDDDCVCTGTWRGNRSDSDMDGTEIISIDHSGNESGGDRSRALTQTVSQRVPTAAAVTARFWKQCTTVLASAAMEPTTTAVNTRLEMLLTLMGEGPFGYLRASSVRSSLVRACAALRKLLANQLASKEALEVPSDVSMLLDILLSMSDTCDLKQEATEQHSEQLPWPAAIHGSWLALVQPLWQHSEGKAYRLWNAAELVDGAFKQLAQEKAQLQRDHAALLQKRNSFGALLSTQVKQRLVQLEGDIAEERRDPYEVTDAYWEAVMSSNGRWMRLVNRVKTYDQMLLVLDDRRAFYDTVKCLITDCQAKLGDDSMHGTIAVDEQVEPIVKHVQHKTQVLAGEISDTISAYCLQLQQVAETTFALELLALAEEVEAFWIPMRLWLPRAARELVVRSFVDLLPGFAVPLQETVKRITDELAWGSTDQTVSLL